MSVFERLAPALALTGAFFAALGTVLADERALGVPGVRGGVVATSEPLAAKLGAQILRQGGNAIDAAAAVAFALNVIEPQSSGIGGGGFMLLWIDGEAEFIDYREIAPLASHRDMYLDENGNVIDGASLEGYLASGVPGTVAGMWAAHQRHGTLPWTDLVTPAIDLARNGFVVAEHLANRAAVSSSRLAGVSNFSDYFSDLKTGHLFKQPDLAMTLERIAEHGTDGFYAGTTADLIVAEMARGGGLITLADLASYEAVWRQPLEGKWRDYDVLSSPPPSSGGFAVIQLLRIKDFLAHEFDGIDHNSVQYIHLVAEISKRVFADRAEYLGDSDYVDVPMERLTSDEYMRMRAREIDPEYISTLDSVAPGLESADTTHYSIVDKDGNAVSNSYTLNLHFGSGVVVEGAGFLLNDEMDDFSARPGVPNAYGLVGAKANAIAPGKRMLSSMSPTFVEGPDRLAILGTPGGSRIISMVLQGILAVTEGQSAKHVVSQPRFHHQYLPDVVEFEPRTLAAGQVIGLQRMGHRLKQLRDTYGNMQIVILNKARHSVSAASDPRGEGLAQVRSEERRVGKEGRSGWVPDH